ncbi:DUF4253 domain-containing protein [Prevotella sp. PINT]|jgi:hypothetical protein|uniref:DUF4253 domain-containing protein n=1 Tax=Palleniella intestinalis TaxID=2736291 RepID=UPI001552DDB6|nr:DUF4253 domain-containing protein [Palleniella intestinalis]NPD82281.1 DUF4253 domain-containing protein [Palleniella intestinalis]
MYITIFIIILAAFCLFIFLKNKKETIKTSEEQSYVPSEKKEESEIKQETEDDCLSDDDKYKEIVSLLEGCRCRPLSPDLTQQELKELWQNEYQRGRKEGFCPILLEINDNFFDSLSTPSCLTEKEEFAAWRQQMLDNPVKDGKALLAERLEEERALFEENDEDADWEEVMVGTSEGAEASTAFDFYGNDILLVEVPVKNPWQIFAYLPMGGWNECPDAEEQMAVAKYWFEKYGAVVAAMSSDTIGYVLPQPVTKDTLELAEEQFAYCPDIIDQGYGSLATLADADKESTVWNFWWD